MVSATAPEAMSKMSSTRSRPAIIGRRRLLCAAGLGFVGLPRAQPGLSFTDLLVVVPGIMGSTLYRDGKMIWGLSPAAFVPILKSGNLDLAHLRDGAGLAPVTVGKVFDTVTLIPGFWKLDGYTGLRERLTSELPAQPGENYFEFAYDWRQDNRKSALQLRDRCSQWLAAWRDKSNNPNARVVLVCHSMGGLIARYATEVLRASDIKAIFTLATPYQGSYAALSRIANGLLTKGLTQTVASFDSVYQLLPTYPCIESSGNFVPLWKTSTPGGGLFDIDRFQSVGLSFHRECDAAAKGRQDAGVKGAELHVIQSSTHNTDVLGRWDGSRLALIGSVKGMPTKGDGTVPAFEYAQPIGIAQPKSLTHLNQLHGTIQNFGGSIGQIVGTLTTGEPSPTRSVRPVSMRCDDVVQAGGNCRVRMELTSVPGTNSRLRLVDTVNDAEVTSVVLEPSIGQTTFDLTLKVAAAGIYRVVYEERGATVCSDLIAGV